MKSVARRLLNEAGYDLLRLKHNNSTIETNLANVLSLQAINCVIDVGANRGQYGQMLRRIGFEGHIISFEPVSDVFAELERSRRGDSRWRCYRLALGREECEREINVYKSTVFSSFLTANDYSKRIWTSLNDCHRELVRVRTLANVFDEVTTGIGAVRCLLKIDTQGFDVDVFDGAEAVLKSIVALQSEIAMIPVYNNMVSGLDALRHYQDYGYYVAGMFPINREESLAVIEFDCLLVRRDGATTTAGAL